MQHRIQLPVLAAFAVVAVLPAQDPVKPPAKTTDPAITKMKQAGDAERSKLLVSYIQGKIASNALYAGQYDDLAELGEPVQKLLQEWILEEPISVVQGDSFRAACIRALRDVHGTKAPETLVATLKEVANDEFEPDSIRQAAMYAVAQFGDRTMVDRVLGRIEQVRKAEKVTPQQQAWAFNQLANIRYNLREYEKAAAVYAELIALHDGGKVQMQPQQLPTMLYNWCCSQALAGQKDAAFATLERALAASRSAGNTLKDSLLATDMDIRSLRADARFAKLLEQHKAGGAAATEASAEKSGAKATSKPTKGK